MPGVYSVCPHSRESGLERKGEGGLRESPWTRCTCVGPALRLPGRARCPRSEPMTTPASPAWKPFFLRSQGKSHNAEVWPWSCALSSPFSSSLNAGKQSACNHQTQNPAAPEPRFQAQEPRVRKELRWLCLVAFKETAGILDLTLGRAMEMVVMVTVMCPYF